MPAFFLDAGGGEPAARGIAAVGAKTIRQQFGHEIFSTSGLPLTAKG